MNKKNIEQNKSTIVVQMDPTECPFREFRDNELAADFWGLGPAAFRSALINKTTLPKPPPDYVWVDEQTQPLPRSVRSCIHGWVRAEELATVLWEAEVVVHEETDGGGKMAIMDTQLNHAQVLLKSSFCRRVLSICFILEKVEGLIVEHQWENFVFSLPSEGWRAKYHIYSPGMKAGGGQQHRPGLSKNGCYLVRLYYLGAWRCIWVTDQVPIDSTGAPLLPFSPLFTNTPITKTAQKQAPVTITSTVVHLWPLLLCKALLKLAAPDMNSDEESENLEDEAMTEFDIMHALTGALSIIFVFKDADKTWQLLSSEVPVFMWDDDDETVASTAKSKSTKKPTTKETAAVRRGSMASIVISDSEQYPPYALPGITPAYEMSLIVTMTRDLPLKRPLPEPEVPLWKHYRWIDWARSHGLYGAYDCPRTKFLKVNGLMKLSYAPHLLDVQSTESITFGFREEHDKTVPPAPKKGGKDVKNQSNTGPPTAAAIQQLKEELREWIQFSAIHELIKSVNVIYYPSMFEFTSAASSPPQRITKAPPNRALDMPVPKSGPLYLQIDCPDENRLRISLSVLHPRILFNCGVLIEDYIEPSYLIVEKFEWFVDCEVPVAKAFVRTRGYDSVEMTLQPGRHFCRIWVHSRMNWTLMLVSESSLLLGNRDLIQSAAVRECPWAAIFLNSLSVAFANWIRVNRSNTNVFVTANDREFYRSYQPDLEWDPESIGYHKPFLHWMFRRALQASLMKRLPPNEFELVSSVLRYYLRDPDFGMPDKPSPPEKCLREIALTELCDCGVSEMEENDFREEQLEEQSMWISEEKTLVDFHVMEQLLTAPSEGITSRVCELATEEVSCSILKEEKEKIIRKHEAATTLQAYWRGTWARKCINTHINATPDIVKILMDSIFGNLEALSSLMNQFFNMFPGAKYAYSVASALSGVYGLQQYNGSSPVTSKCKWVPYFQGVYYCHASVKVHLDIQSTLEYHTIAVYNNDNGEQMPQAYNAHITFDFEPNFSGYTIMGHGILKETLESNSEAQWQLTVLSSIEKVFHICDNNDFEYCKQAPLPSATKLHIEEIFLPNRRNILGGIQITVLKQEAISLRVAATSPDLEMKAVLRTASDHTAEELIEIGRCAGTGELYWPYISLTPSPPELLTTKNKSYSQVQVSGKDLSSARSLKSTKTGGKTRSTTKIKDGKYSPLPKQYWIQVTAPNGWPLTLAQWSRVEEVRNSTDSIKTEVTPKKQTKEKPSPGKDKDKSGPVGLSLRHPHPGDAYIELECSLAIGGGAIARRDDERDIEFLAARRSWDVREPGRNLRGAEIRKEFRAEYLVLPPPPPSDSAHTLVIEETYNEEEDEEGKDKKDQFPTQQGPTPMSESGLLEMSVETEEELKYITMPEQLKDKFIPLHFVPLCTKEKIEEESVLITPEIEEAAKKERHARFEDALERMRQLQLHNEIYILGRQKERGFLLEKLFVDATWPSELAVVFEERDDAIAREVLCRQLSANKKKQDVKKK